MKGSSLSGNVGLLSGACRDPYWEELTDEQKIEVLSRRAESQEREIRDLRSMLRTLLKHTHSPDGLQVPLKEALREDVDGEEQYCQGSGKGIFNREKK